LLKWTDLQMIFLDTNYLFGRLVPKDDFCRIFREKVAVLIKNEHFEDMYCPDNGRQAGCCKLTQNP